MKKFFLFIFGFLALTICKSNACMCDILETNTIKYQSSDFVAIVKILKNYKNEPDSSEYYKADVEVINLYKGKKIKQLSILGTNGGSRYNSCGTFIPEGEARLIFGNFDGKSNVSTYLCNSYVNPLEISFKRDKLGEKLNLLKKYGKHVNIDTRWGRTIYIPNKLYQTSTTDTAYQFSLVKIVISKDGVVKKIQHLTKDSAAFIDKLDVVLNTKIDWPSRIKRYKTKHDLTFFLELNPYVRIKPMKLM